MQSEGLQWYWRGGMVKELTEGDGRIRAVYGDNYDRLVALKCKYDPQNFFSVNQNVKPGDRRRSGQ